LATNLPAFQSSYWDTNFPADLAVDGSRKSVWNEVSCVHSRLETNQWWAVDLGVPLTVNGVHFTNRADGMYSRTKNWREKIVQKLA